MKKIMVGGTAAIAILAWISYLVAHVGGAIVLFKSVKLWLFLVILLVPGIGDVAGVFCMIKTGSCWPIALYGASIILCAVSGMLSKAADNRE